jgi:hypothetical protein
MTFPPRPLALRLCLLTLALSGYGAQAQPDPTPRRIVPVVPPAPLSAAELQEVMGGPTLITFSGKDVPIQEILRVFCTAAGFPAENATVRPGDSRKPLTLSVDWKAVPFWTAAREVETLTGLRWSTRSWGALTLSPTPPWENGGLNGRVIAETPYVKIVANSVTRSSTVTVPLEGEPANGKTADGKPVKGEILEQRTGKDNLTVSLSIYLDPKLQLEMNNLQVSGLRTSADNNLLPNRQSNATTYFGRNSELITGLNLTLNSGLGSGTKIAKISGVVQTSVVLSSHVWEVKDVGNAPKSTNTVNGAVYSFEGASNKDTGLRLDLSVSQDAERDNGGGARDAFGPFNNIRIIDATGRGLRQSGRSLSGGGGDRFKMGGQISFNVNGLNGKALQGPYTMQWSIPTKSRPLQIPFELRDVVVP